MHDSTASVRLEIRNRRMLECFREIIQEEPRLRMLNSAEPLGIQNRMTCDLLVCEIGEDAASDFQFVRTMQESGAAGEIFLTSERTEPGVLLEALRTGAREFIPQPLNRDEAAASFSRFMGRRMQNDKSARQERRGKIVTFTGSKGGVGTTTVAVNLAAAFAKAGGKKSVALIDMNVLFGEVPIFLDIQSSINWGEVTRDIARLDSSYLMSTLVKHPSGVYVLPSPTRLDGMQSASPENLAMLVTQMRSTFHYVVIDCGNKLNDISLKIMELSDTVYVVSELTLPCLVNVKRLIEILQKLGFDERNIQVVVNRHHKRSPIPLEEAEKSLNRKVSWLIPNDYDNVMLAINQGKTLESAARGTALAKNFRQFAATFHAKAEPLQDKGTLLETIFGKKNDRE